MAFRNWINSFSAKCMILMGFLFRHIFLIEKYNYHYVGWKAVESLKYTFVLFFCALGYFGINGYLYDLFIGRCSYENHSHQVYKRWVETLTFKLRVLAFRLVRVDMEVRAPPISHKLGESASHRSTSPFYSFSPMIFIRMTEFLKQKLLIAIHKHFGSYYLANEVGVSGTLLI